MTSPLLLPTALPKNSQKSLLVRAATGFRLRWLAYIGSTPATSPPTNASSRATTVMTVTRIAPVRLMRPPDPSR